MKKIFSMQVTGINTIPNFFTEMNSCSLSLPTLYLKKQDLLLQTWLVSISEISRSVSKIQVIA
jgi:hypothetical protein